MAALPSTETLQLVVLHALEAHGAVADSRQLRLALPATVETDDGARLPPLEHAATAPVVGPSVDAQNALKSALDSLATREVSRALFVPGRIISDTLLGRSLAITAC